MSAYCSWPGILAASEERPILKIGVTGHQRRAGAHWKWVAQELKRTLDKVPLPFEGWTSLAVGADQMFAQACLNRGGKLVTVIPIADYERFFESEPARLGYLSLLASSARIVRLDHPDPSSAFLVAGRHIVNECRWLIAIWDGAPSRGVGGTADIVAYARSLGRAVTVLDPLVKSTTFG